MSEYLIEGPLPTALLKEFADQLSRNPRIGAQDIFLGQIRNDEINGQAVVAIEYSAYAEMAEKVFAQIVAEARQKFNLLELVVKHSMGAVAVGELSLIVLAAGEHRKETLAGLRWTVEAIKAQVPVFGKEILADQSHQWKVNR